VDSTPGRGTSVRGVVPLGDGDHPNRGMRPGAPEGMLLG
jgi:hypothetical protein